MEYDQKERECFEWKRPDGTPAFADPLVKYRHLQALLEGDIDRVAREYRGDNPGLRHQATEQIAWAVCEAFGLPAFDEGTGDGTPAAFCVSLLGDFLRWRKKKWPSGVTTSGSCSPG